MVNPVGMSSQSPMRPMGPPPDAKLTDEQQAQLQEILSNYDPDNMTEDAIQELLGELKSAGIRPGEDLKAALESAGFDVDAIRAEAMENRPAPPDGTNMAQSPQFIMDFIEEFEAGNITDEQLDEFVTMLKSSFSHLGNFLDTNI